MINLSDPDDSYFVSKEKKDDEKEHPMRLRNCLIYTIVCISILFLMPLSWGHASDGSVTHAQEQLEIAQKKIDFSKIETENLKIFRQLLFERGPQILLSIIILIIGILIVKQVTRTLKLFLEKVIKKEEIVSIISNGTGLILFSLIVAAAAIEAGANPRISITFITLVNLACMGLLIIFRPLLPKLPFQKGNVIEFGTYFGIVEATSFLNTQIRTFEGKTFFVPNRKIVDEVIINYHFTTTRRVRLNVVIGYDQNLARAKQLLEAIMTADPRVKIKPAPVVYVLDLGNRGVKIGGRCWVDNKKFWTAKCELTEKIKYEFDHEGIKFAYPQLDIHFCDSVKTNDNQGGWQ